MDRTEGKDPGSVNTGVWRHRRDTIVQETGHDAYRARKHADEPTVCGACEAVFHDGRWTWMDAPPANAHETVCPACQRAHDGYPAGFLTLAGPFFDEHRREIINLIENESAAETAEHPLHRKIETEDTGNGYLLTTTDVHLCRRLGERLHRAYGGDLEYHYVDEDAVLRASWTR